MDIFYYIMIFIMGTVFGSFFTLAVYRIPLKKDITHERSFCPNCNHKLGFWDMIPVLSYICFRGKCRYCGEKIRIRYLILEVLSGLVFLIEYMALNMHFPDLSFAKIAYFISFVFMYVTIAIISGIDKEYRRVHLGVLLFGFIMQGIYILYLYVTLKEGVSVMYRYGMYLILMILLCALDTFFLKEKAESKYVLEVLMLLSYIGGVVGSELLLIIALLSIVLIIIDRIAKQIKKIANEKPDILQENFIPKTRIGFFVGMSAIIVTIAETFLKYM